MGVINLLPQEVSDKIAAGEVVERPASVVKELVENSIDAGATKISVEIQNGGRSFIRVTDNGCGMSMEDAKLCFVCHATSKVKTAADLDAIYTLGFRGEALASIGAISNVNLITKRPQDEAGTSIQFDGGKMESCCEAGAENGTTIIVTNLFFNTPARLKFMKRDATEAGYIADYICRFILAHPEISFRFIKDGKEQYFTPGDNSIINAMYAVYGREYAKAAIEVDYEAEGIRVSGLIGKGETARANRGYQSFFINHRYIRSAEITRAVEDAYKNQIMIGKFPVAALNIEIDPHNIDINVHPTKLEVKFSTDSRVYYVVYHAVKNALYALPHLPEIERKPTPEVEEEPNILPREAAAWESVKLPSQKGGFSAYEKKNIPKQHYTPEKSVPKASAEPKSESDSQPFSYEIKEDKQSFIDRQMQITAIDDGPLSELRSEQKRIRGIHNLPHNFRVIGQLFSTYILVEQDDSLLMIDQHAAHERLKYEELKAELAKRRITPQMLIMPVPVELSPVERALYDEHCDALLELGFETEEKEGRFYIKSVPSPMDEEELVGLFVELLTQLGENRAEVIGKTKERLTYTIACKAAIKANHKFSEPEMYELVCRVLEMENINTCPHGRPIIIKMTKKEIEKEFGRTL